jgi:mercuric ion transport protein
MQKHLGLSYLGSLSALGVASCCVLPMALMLFGLGGSSIAIFGKIAAASYYVLAASSLLIAVSLFVSFRRRSIMRLKWWLAGSTGLTVLAWAVVIHEASISNFLIMQM